jgi:tetratricopeptide (TPR) repeat protein
MAPEQAGGHVHDIGPGTDVYALGVILYELLTGRPPFKAASAMDTIFQVLSVDPVPPSRLQHQVPRDLETICLKCLQKEPPKRYGSAEDLAEDLRRFLAGEAIKARPVSLWERGVKWARRRPAVAALAAVCVLTVLSLVTGVVLYQKGQLLKKEHQLQESQRLYTARLAAEGLYREGEQALAAQQWERAQQVLSNAQARIGDESALADLKEQVENALGKAKHEVEKALAEAKDKQDRLIAKQRADNNVREFSRLRDRALLHETLMTVMSQEDAPANWEASTAAAQEALALVGIKDSSALPNLNDLYDEEQRSEIRRGSYALLLTLAELHFRPVQGQVGAGREPARTALRYLDHAAKLGFTTRTHHARRARYLERQGDKAGAQRELEMAKQKAPDSALDFALLGMDAYRHGDLREAKKNLSEAQRRATDTYSAQFYLALCHLQLGDWNAAEAYLNACLSHQKDFAWPYLLLGHAHSEQGAFDAAAAAFQEAEQRLRGHPDPTAAFGVAINRGVLWVRQKRYDEAIGEFKKAQALKPKQYQAYANLAQAYRGWGKLDEAVASLDRAIEYESRLPVLYRARAHLQVQRGDLKSALRDFDKATALDRPDAKAAAEDHVQKGLLHHRHKQYGDALRAYDAALKIDKSNALAHRGRGEVLLALKRRQEAAKAFDSYFAHETHPSAAVYRERARVRAELGNRAGAVTDYTLALQLEPDAPTHAARGWVYLVSEAHDLALADFDAAIRLDPELADAYNGRGFARVKLLASAKAAAEAREKLRRAVADAETALRKGLAEPQPPDDVSRLYYNAVRIFAQAAGWLDAEARRSLAAREPGASYQARAVELLRQAVEAYPAPRRADFWRYFVHEDAALVPIRRSADFAKLAAEVSRGVK